MTNNPSRSTLYRFGVWVEQKIKPPEGWKQPNGQRDIRWAAQLLRKAGLTHEEAANILDLAVRARRQPF